MALGGDNASYGSQSDGSGPRSLAASSRPTPGSTFGPALLVGMALPQSSRWDTLPHLSTTWSASVIEAPGNGLSERTSPPGLKLQCVGHGPSPGPAQEATHTLREVHRLGAPGQV